MAGTVITFFGLYSTGGGLPGGETTTRSSGASDGDLLVNSVEDVREDLVPVYTDVEVRGVQSLGRVVLCPRLSKRPADDLLDLDRGLHALVDVGEVAERIVPALLQAQVEDDVPVSSCEEVCIVVFATL